MRASITAVAAALSSANVVAGWAPRGGGPGSYGGANGSVPSTGFNKPQQVSSAGGKAVCVQGSIAVAASAMNEVILLSENMDQYNTTEFFAEFLQVDSTIPTRVNGGMKTVAGTYSIYGQLCYPNGKVSGSGTLQFLTHGINFDRSYWNILPGYSYVDYAAEQGYATFLYDRLGVGQSEHPDPIEVVQSYLELAVAHSLVQGLRAGTIGGFAWQKIAGVGHSFGSIISTGVAAQYPTDFDALILQGFSIDSAGLPATIAAFNPTIAAQNIPQRFAGLPHGYLTVNNAVGDQLAFLRYPAFDPRVFQYTHARRQTYTLGEIITLTAIVAPATSFTGPVDVVDGANDFIFCQGDCLYPVDQAAAVLPALFPASVGSQSYNVPGTGHAINVQTTADLAYAQQIAFLRANGL